MSIKVFVNSCCKTNKEVRISLAVGGKFYESTQESDFLRSSIDKIDKEKVETVMHLTPKGTKRQMTHEKS